MEEFKLKTLKTSAFETTPPILEPLIRNKKLIHVHVAHVNKSCYRHVLPSVCCVCYAAHFFGLFKALSRRNKVA